MGVQPRRAAAWQRLGTGYSPTGVDDDPAQKNVDRMNLPLRRYVFATCYILIHAGLVFYWAGFPLVNTIFLYGYTGMGPAPNPGPFQNARWSDWYDYVALIFMCFNALVPLSLAYSLMNNAIEEYGRMHKFLSMFNVASNFVIFFFLTVMWIFFCDNGGSGAMSACNDYRWCCVFYPSVWCPNTIACNPVVTASELSRNGEMWQHWFMCIPFFVLAWWNITYNDDLREFSVLH